MNNRHGREGRCTRRAAGAVAGLSVLLSAGLATGGATAQGVAPAPRPDPPSPAAAASANAPSSAPTPAPSAAPAPDGPPAKAAATELQRVEITGGPNPTTERRQSTAAKIVIGREEIAQFGDSALADVLKRLPSVTIGGRPGRGGTIRMRGMGGGYTQILIDGERLPPGFAIDQLDPEQVERIEVIRAPTAETGARAIAGTINIVLREPLRTQGDDLRVALGSEGGRAAPSASWTRNQPLGPGLNASWTVGVSRVNQRTDTTSLAVTTDLASGLPVLVQRTTGSQVEERDNLNLNGRLQWRLVDGDQLMLQPFLALSQSERRGNGQLSQPLGATPAPYASSRSSGESDTAIGRLSLMWRTRLPDASRLETRGHVGAFLSSGNSAVNQVDALGQPVLDQRTGTRINDRSWNLTSKWSKGLGDGHSLVAGLEAEGLRRRETQQITVNGVDALADFGGNVQASTQRLAAYLQDEWDPSPRWSAYAGLRWEGLRTRSDSGGVPVDNGSHVLTPLLHAVWRLDEAKRDQLRFSLTRSYRAPTLQNLVSLPSLSTLYPAPGPNTAISPDRAGNAGLRPELASGIDVAYEHYLPAGGVVSVSLFRRQIQDLIRNVTALEAVAWADAQRYVSRPRNLGTALSQGIELDAKFQLEDLVAGAPPVSLRGNLGLYQSRVDGVPGPDNRIDQQPRASLNVGGDHRWRGLPLTLGANLNWVPPYAVQQTEFQRIDVDLRRVIDVYALWTFGPGTRLRFSVANLAARDHVSGSSIVDGGQVLTTTSRGPTRTQATLRLELKV